MGPFKAGIINKSCCFSFNIFTFYNQCTCGILLEKVKYIVTKAVDNSFKKFYL